MKFLRYIAFSLLLLLTSFSVQAQDFTIYYESEQSGSIATVRLYLLNNLGTDIDLLAANFSIAYTSGTASLNSISNSWFEANWGAGFHIHVEGMNDAFLPKEYGGTQFQHRVWYGASIPLGGSPIKLSPGGSPTLAFEAEFTVTGVASFYSETSVEFPGNGFSSTVSPFLTFDIQPLSAFPVEWLDFTVQPIGDRTVQLDWVTATEENNAAFEIERSTDQLNFVKIGEVEGAGTSSSAKLYQWIDKKADQSVLYYRLKQKDFNGNYSYSDIREVHMTNFPNRVLTVFPNPTQSDLNLHLGAKEMLPCKLEVQDMTGRTLLKMSEVELGTKDYTMPVEAYPAGVYSVKVIESKTGKVYSSLFMKQ
ncbi:MAG: T9SS type A sorting domain-containing protein [Bacteroidota bacterium]